MPSRSKTTKTNGPWANAAENEPWIPTRDDARAFANWISKPEAFTAIVRPGRWARWKLANRPTGLLSRLTGDLREHGITEIVLTSEFELFGGWVSDRKWYQDLAQTIDRYAIGARLLHCYFTQQPDRPESDLIGSSWPIPFRIIFNQRLVDLMAFEDDLEVRSRQVAEANGLLKETYRAIWTPPYPWINTADPQGYFQCDCYHWSRATRRARNDQSENACSHTKFLGIVRRGPKQTKPKPLGGRKIALSEDE